MQPAHPGELNIPRDNPSTWEPQYTDSYKWQVIHDDNKAGQPLPRERDEFGQAYVQGQAILDRLDAVHKGVEDPELYADWIVSVIGTGLYIRESWENPELVHKAIEEMNNRAIDLVRQTLREQVGRLQPFQWDSPRLKQEKEKVARERITILNSISTYGSPISIKMEGSWQRAPFLIRRYPSINGQTHQSYWQGEMYEANDPLKFLIHVSETGEWENLKCSNDYNEYCGLP